MITVQTRQNSKGKWWCNCTVKGYDISFEENNARDAQLIMMDELYIKRNISPAQVKWESVQLYNTMQSSSLKPPITSATWRIDKGMI